MKRKPLAYWRGFEAGLEGWPLLGVPGQTGGPEKAADVERGYREGVRIRDALRGVQRATAPKQDTRPTRSSTWKAGYGAAMRGETLGDLLWQQDRPAERAELEAGYAVGLTRRGKPAKPKRPPKRQPPKMTPIECADWDFRQKLLAQFARR